MHQRVTRLILSTYRYRSSVKPGTPTLCSTRLHNKLRERIRYLQDSVQTEKAYLYWVRFFVRWHGRAGVMRHPRVMGAARLEGLNRPAQVSG